MEYIKVFSSHHSGFCVHDGHLDTGFFLFDLSLVLAPLNSANGMKPHTNATTQITAMQI